MGWRRAGGKGTTACPGDPTTRGQDCVDVTVDPVCAEGDCASVCQTEYADCNNDMSDGCEIELAVDLQHWGSCGAACPDSANATESCTAGQCLLDICNQGFPDCDNMASTGGEANVSTDSLHCGMCGKACAVGEMCGGGVCIPAGCQNGGVLVATSPGGDMKVCDDPNDATCEKDVEMLCPVGWGLCSRSQYVNRHNGWTHVVNGSNVVVAEIYCRGGSGAGHFTLGPYGGISNLGQDIDLNGG